MAQLDMAWATTKTWLIQLTHDVGANAWDTPVQATPLRTLRDAVVDMTNPASPEADATIPTDLNFLEQFRHDDVAARKAPGWTPDRTAPASVVAFVTYDFGVDYGVRVSGLLALMLRYGGKERTIGDGPVEATVSANSRRLLRVAAEYWSRSQIDQQ